MRKHSSKQTVLGRQRGRCCCCCCCHVMFSTNLIAKWNHIRLNNDGRQLESGFQENEKDRIQLIPMKNELNKEG